MINFQNNLFYFAMCLALISSTLSDDNPMVWKSVLAGRNFTPRECTMCRFSIGLASYALKTRRGAEQVSQIASNFCVLANIESPLVCSNISKIFEQEIVKVISYGVVTPNQICGLLSNNTCGSFHNPLSDWRVSLNNSYSFDTAELARIGANKNRLTNNSQPYKVIHISDPHVDLEYLEGSVADCNEPICCQASSSASNTSSLKAGRWGFDRCDVPMRTFESALKEIRRIVDSTDDVLYIIWTGDLQPHDVWKQDTSKAIRTYHAIFRKIFDYLPDTKIYPTLGNHEMVPVDSFSPSNLLTIAREDSPEWLYKALHTYWSRWLPNDTARTITKDGFYSVEVRKGLRLISLNTNFCHNKNFWLYINSTDPGNQLKWLIHELQVSELAHESVHIIGHIPPGCGDCFKVWSRNFNNIIRRFSKTVTAQFYGHTHMDEFEIFYDKLPGENEIADPRPISVAFIGPSITSVSGNNPSFRVYTIDPDKNYASIDYKTFFMNLTEANQLSDQQEPSWISSKSFTDQFEILDTSPESLHNLVLNLTSELDRLDLSSNMNNRPIEMLEVLKNNSNKHPSKLYELYRLHHTYSDSFSQNNYRNLTNDSRRKFLCSFITSQSHDNSTCAHFIQVKV